MAFVFDMRRLHHGCGESLLVRPLKAECSARSAGNKQQQGSEKSRALVSHFETQNDSLVRPWE